jgi:hypothetical protein
MNKTKPNVLIYCRDYLIPDFKVSVGPLEQSYSFHFLTDGTFSDVQDTRSRFYSLLNTTNHLTGWDENDENNAITRCRLLRGLTHEQAIKMLRSMGTVLKEELNRINPAFVLGQMVDEYSTYLLAELANRRGIKYLGVCYSYFPNRIQITQFWNGSPYPCRLVADSEAQDALEVVTNRTFRQDYHLKGTYSFCRHLISVVKYKFKSILFPILATIKRDPYNLHYSILPFVADRRALTNFPRALDFHPDWTELAKQAVAKNGKPIVYIPLGYFPECSIDYWINNTRILNYESVIVEICTILSANFNILVKEHPHMLGARNRHFYSALKNISNVISIPPSEFSHDACVFADAVLIGGGSIGIESYVRGKAIASFCDTSYWYKASEAEFLDLSALETWTATLQQLISKHKPPSEHEKLEFIRACLSTTIRQKNKGIVWPIPKPDDLAFLFEKVINSKP